MNLSVFYRKVRAEFFNGRLSQQQTDGLAAILQKWNRSGFTDLR